MKKSGINLENVKIRNKASILKLLNQKGAMSRKDIAAEVGLTPAAVTLLTTEMIEAGYLREEGALQEEKRAGRRKILVNIVYDWKCVLAVSIEVHKTTISLCTLDGTPLKHHEMRTDSAAKPEKFLKNVAKECKALMYEAGKGPDTLLGAGVSIPGLVNRETGVSKHAYGVWDVEVPVVQLLSADLNCPVVLENNIRAFGEGELLYGIGRAYRNMLFLRWGPGVGSAIVIDDKIYDGYHHHAGEIGHYIIEPDGIQCRCGRRGCLETRVSTQALTAQICQVYSAGMTPLLVSKTGDNKDMITEDYLLSLLEDVQSISNEELDPVIQKILSSAIDSFACTFVNTATILSPDHVAIFGSMFDNEAVRTAFLTACQRYDPKYDNHFIHLADNRDKLAYIGPAAVAIRDMFLENPA